jgi:hypothetical protein
MSFLSGLLPGMGDRRDSTTTTQTDGRTVTDYSGANVGQTINIYGATGDTMKQFLQGNQQASPWANSAQATGQWQGGETLPGSGALSPATLAIGAAVLLAIVALKR